MQVSEYLDDLCSLDRTGSDLRHPGLTREKRDELEHLAGEIRGRLPTALLTHYDRRARAGERAIAPVHGTACGGCHLKLPVGMLADISQPGRIAVCPHCGIFAFKVIPNRVPTHV